MSNSFVTPWTGAYQTPLSMGFCRQEYWSRLPFPFPGNLPNPGAEPTFSALKGRFLPLSHQFDHMILLFLTSWGSSILLSTVAVPIYSLRNSEKQGSALSVSSPTLVSFCPFNSSHFNRGEVISHWSFDLHFLNN